MTDFNLIRSDAEMGDTLPRAVQRLIEAAEATDLIVGDLLRSRHEMTKRLNALESPAPKEPASEGSEAHVDDTDAMPCGHARLYYHNAAGGYSKVGVCPYCRPRISAAPVPREAPEIVGYAVYTGIVTRYFCADDLEAAQHYLSNCGAGSSLTALTPHPASPSTKGDGNG